VGEMKSFGWVKVDLESNPGGNLGESLRIRAKESSKITFFAFFFFGMIKNVLFGWFSGVREGTR